MITQSQMYWLTRLDSIQTVGSIIGVLTIVLGICVFFFGIGAIVNKSDHFDDGSQKTADVLWKVVKRIMLAFITCLLLCISLIVFVPTTKEMAAILIVPKIANSEKVQQAGNRLYELAVEWMEELRPQQNRNPHK